MFSEFFNVSEGELEEYGAVNISLIADIPLFVDPILIFNSEKKEYKDLYKSIIKYMYFLANKAKNKLDDKEIKTWFTFKEVYNNWLGFSMVGNKGQALNLDFGKKLYNNISFVLNNNNISSGYHVEKIMLLYPGSGKDKISDMTVNLIKGYLCRYTEKFAREYIKNKAKYFYVERDGFNYETETFTSNKYYLPYIINEKGKEEYVLLTPKDILRKDEQSINRNDFLNKMEMIRNSIDNNSLRIQLDDSLKKGIIDYENGCEILNRKPKASEESKIKREIFETFAKDHNEIYDYYIKLVEENGKNIKDESRTEVEIQELKFNKNVLALKMAIENNKKLFNNSNSSLEEAKKRVLFFKKCIEDNEFYKLFYGKDNSQIITKEKDLQKMFRLVWCGSIFKLDSEVNNGRGPADFVVSMGSEDVTVIEFKLANNTKLNHTFKQLSIYGKANNTENKVAVFFYFNDTQYKKVTKVINKLNLEKELNKTIFLIDCSIKESASKPNAR